MLAERFRRVNTRVSAAPAQNLRCPVLGYVELVMSREGGGSRNFCAGPGASGA
jgi:hypothetical protein